MNIRDNNTTKLLLALFWFILSSHAWSGDDIFKAPAPEWVAPEALPEISDLPDDKIENGVYYLLFEGQILADPGKDPVYFYHNAEYIVNQAGVESNSQINIGYYPSYQKLVLHSLRVVRDGKSIDKIESSRMNLIQREEEMDALIFNGRMTLNIILDDVRTGDIIEYSYSRRGMNPVYQNLFAYSQYVNWSVPVGRFSLRLLWNKPLPLQYQIKNSTLKLEQTKTADGIQYQIHGERLDPVKKDDNTPPWFTPWGEVYFSELKSWEEVSRWGAALYHDTIIADSNIDSVVADIKSKHHDLDARISAALRFVQDEIRYLGIELGHNSHKPTPAPETLRNRYGDCKDKTVLLLTLLKGLGVESYPVLVNTNKDVDSSFPNIHAFDHVITYVRHKNKQYWLDPTRAYQYGSIDNVHQSDYKLALVLRPGTTDLTRMAPNNPKHGIFVKDHFSLRANSEVEFSSETTYYGWNAERQRQRSIEKGQAQLQREYLEFFQRYYPKIAMLTPVSYTDDAENNIFVTTEQYRIEGFWEDKANKRRHEANFYANILSSQLAIPDEPSRNHPFVLRHPEHIEQVIEIDFDEDDWDFEDEQFVEDNPFFRFTSDVKFHQNERRLTQVYTYQSKAEHVDPEDYPAYLAGLQRVDMYKTYIIYKSYDEEAVAEEPDPWYFAYLNATNVLWAYAGLYLVIFVLWRLERRRNPDNPNAVFYPVSLFKFAAMWILTLGLYGIYWFYRNFRYLKEQEDNATMPVARGIFNVFWYYPLWRKLKEDNHKRFGQSHLPGKSLAIVLALAFFAVGVSSYINELAMLSLVLSALLTLPLVNYIVFANQGTSAVADNSKWRFRHYLLAILSVPLIFLSAGSDIGLLPSDAVVKGSRLLSHDIKMMQRRGIINPGDDIEYFYSDALLFIGDDGNGFTQRHVFSYWKDENNSLVQDQATYGQIKDIRVDWNPEFGENTTVTIVKDDDSEFLLYVSNSDRKDRDFVNALKQRWIRDR